MLALLLAASAAPHGLFAVLELKNRAGAETDASYFSNRVRTLALDAMPGVQLMTQENMLTLLAASGKKLEDCEGECEVETGRRLGAAYVVSGEVVRLGAAFKLSLRLHETSGGLMLSGALASGAGPEQLDAALPAAVSKLLAPLRPQARESAMAPRGEVLPMSDVIPPPPPADMQAKAAEPLSQVIWFDELEAGVGGEMQKTLEQVAERLRRMPGVTVRVEGHAAPDELRPQELSHARARAVRDFLVDRGISADRLLVKAAGVSSSVLAPGSQKGSAGRRVEFIPAQ